MSRTELHPDPNYPGLYCCAADLDDLDPYRLAPRETENITMEWVRPDVSLNTHSPRPLNVVPALTTVWLQDDFGNYIQDEFGNPISLGPSGVSKGSPIPLPAVINPTYPWQAQTIYESGDSVTPLNQNNPSVALPQYQFVCIFSGFSGQAAPNWPTMPGVVFMDNTVTWLCYGVYLDEGTGTAFPANFNITAPGPHPRPVVPSVPAAPVGLNAAVILSTSITLTWIEPA